MPKGFNKVTRIQVACEKLEIAHEDIYAFGDSVNNLDMLKYVPTVLPWETGRRKRRLLRIM